MAIQIVNKLYNPVTGVFGNGQVQMFVGPITGSTNTTVNWAVPPGVAAVRVRLWGGGGSNNGSGGGFALRTIYGLDVGSTIVITIGVAGGSTGGTSSFGSFVSATGGATAAGAVGSGVGGDINYSGGIGGASGGGGGAASIFGAGSSVTTTAVVNTGVQGFGGAGAGAFTTASLQAIASAGFTGSGSIYTPGLQIGTTPAVPAAFQVNSRVSSGMNGNFSIDLLGTGGGASTYQHGINGGGGSGTALSTGGLPGGGGGASGAGGPGVVILEY